MAARLTLETGECESGVAGAGKPAEDSMENAGRKIESVGEKMEKAFSALSWAHHLDAFEPIHSISSGGCSDGNLVGRGGFNEGGYVRGPAGIDTVPAWLTPGEFVVNAAAAQRNAGRLAAVNDGVTLPGSPSAVSSGPNGAQRFASGGTVEPQGTPPVHVTANITVNPPPGANPRDIARSVVEELARLKIRGRG